MKKYALVFLFILTLIYIFLLDSFVKNLFDSWIFLFILTYSLVILIRKDDIEFKNFFQAEKLWIGLFFIALILDFFNF